MNSGELVWVSTSSGALWLVLMVSDRFWWVLVGSGRSLLTSGGFWWVLVSTQNAMDVKDRSHLNPRGHRVAGPQCHKVTRSQCRRFIWLQGHRVTWSQGRRVIGSRGSQVNRVTRTRKRS